VPGTYERVHQSSDRLRKHRPWIFKAFAFHEAILSAGHLNRVSSVIYSSCLCNLRLGMEESGIDWRDILEPLGGESDGG